MTQSRGSQGSAPPRGGNAARLAAGRRGSQAGWGVVGWLAKSPTLAVSFGWFPSGRMGRRLRKEASRNYPTAGGHPPSFLRTEVTPRPGLPGGHVQCPAAKWRGARDPPERVRQWGWAGSQTGGRHRGPGLTVPQQTLGPRYVLSGSTQGSAEKLARHTVVDRWVNGRGGPVVPRATSWLEESRPAL